MFIKTREGVYEAGVAQLSNLIMESADSIYGTEGSCALGYKCKMVLLQPQDRQ